jgi:hypothetical protein
LGVNEPSRKLYRVVVARMLGSKTVEKTEGKVLLEPSLENPSRGEAKPFGSPGRIF